MAVIIIVVLVVVALLFFAMRASPEVKEKLATTWAAIVALALAVVTWLISWWADVPMDVPSM